MQSAYKGARFLLISNLLLIFHQLLGNCKKEIEYFPRKEIPLYFGDILTLIIQLAVNWIPPSKFSVASNFAVSMKLLFHLFGKIFRRGKLFIKNSLTVNPFCWFGDGKTPRLMRLVVTTGVECLNHHNFNLFLTQTTPLSWSESQKYSSWLFRKGRKMSLEQEIS